MDRIIQKMNFADVLDKAMKYMFDNCVFYHNSIEDYFDRKPPLLKTYLVP